MSVLHHRSILTTIVLTAICAGTAPAGADEPAPAPKPRGISVGVRAYVTPGLGPSGGWGLGFEGSYAVHPAIDLGMQLKGISVNKGNDAQPCQDCVFSGSMMLAFAEGRFRPEQWFTPYGRLGLGYAILSAPVVAGGAESQYGETDWALDGEVGLELHGALSLRLFAFQTWAIGTQFKGNPFQGYGLQLGARF